MPTKESTNVTDEIVVDLFAGPGGWDTALRDHLQCPMPVVGIEWDAAACATRAAAGHATVQANVAAVRPRGNRGRGRVAGLIASPPCGPWSSAGRQQGLADPRGPLVWEPLAWAEQLLPDWIACEQVPAVVPIWGTMAHRLRELGYRTWYGVLNAADYGVPQTRERAILLARRGGAPVGPPLATHTRLRVEEDLFGGERLPWITMAEALGWGMTERPSVTVVGGAHRTGGHAPLDGGSGSRETLRRAKHDGLWIDGPADGQDGHGSVRLSVAEAGVLQSFRPDYPWQGTAQEQFLQVGNAVPPLLAAHLIHELAGWAWQSRELHLAVSA